MFQIWAERRALRLSWINRYQGRVIRLLPAPRGPHLVAQATRPSRDRPMSEMTDPAPATNARTGLIRRLPLVAILLTAALGAFFLRDVLSFETLAANREALIAFRDANYLATVAVFIALYVAIVAFSLPGATVATLTGGFLFGTFPGALFNVTAATIGAAAIFLAARWGLGERLAARMDASEGRVKRIKDGIDRNQWEMLFLIRLVPLVPFFVANLVPALVGVPLSRFVITTFLGIIPGALVYTSAGAGLGEVFAQGTTPDLGILFEPQILLPILGLAALAALPIIIKAVRGKKDI
jgi:uncharacterized membrane protein YdjX (TVP38/TMEM64 family)